jgi:hypothetical protein
VDSFLKFRGTDFEANSMLEVEVRNISTKSPPPKKKGQVDWFPYQIHLSYLSMGD